MRETWAGVSLERVYGGCSDLPAPHSRPGQDPEKGAPIATLPEHGSSAVGPRAYAWFECRLARLPYPTS